MKQQTHYNHSKQCKQYHEDKKKSHSRIMRSKKKKERQMQSQQLQQTHKTYIQIVVLSQLQLVCKNTYMHTTHINNRQ